MDNSDLVALTAYMAEVGYSASEVAYAVEKPWLHEDILKDARQAEYEERTGGYAIVIEALPKYDRPPMAEFTPCSHCTGDHATSQHDSLLMERILRETDAAHRVMFRS